MPSIVEFLHSIRFDQDAWFRVQILLWRSVLLGTALYLAFTENPARNLRYNAIAFIVAYIWSYYDGVLTKRKWSTSWTEGLCLHLLTVQIGNILIVAFGSPLATAT